MLPEASVRRHPRAAAAPGSWRRKTENRRWGTLSKKRSRLIDAVLALAPAPSPLHNNGDSEDKSEGSSGDSATLPRSPVAPVEIAPERAMPAFSIQFSEPETESDEESAPKTHATAGSATEAEKRAEKTALSSSGGEEEEEAVNVVDSNATAKGKQVVAEGNSGDSDSSDSSAYLIS